MALIGTSSSLMPTSIGSVKIEKKLQQLHDKTFKLITEQIKNVLTNLQAFIASDISFSAKVHFNEPFCKDFVRERLLVPYLKHIAEIDQQVEQLLLLRQQLTETLQGWTDKPVKDDQFICPNLALRYPLC